MTHHSQLAHRIFNRPHLVDPNYARVFVGALSDRLGIRSLVTADGTQLSDADLRSAADGYQSGRRSIVDSVEGIAIIPIEGTLMHKYGHIDPFSGATGYDGVHAKLEEALDDPSIRGIVLDINSPGGEVSGCFDLADFIYEARQRKPIWALADEWAASAAYALASAADRVIAPRTAEIGSVGVLTMHVDQSQLVEEMGLDVTFIFAGDHKIDGNPFEPLPDTVRADIQSEIDAVYQIFVSTVARNRGLSEDAVRETEARVYNARDARSVSFVDEVMAARKVLPAFDAYLSDQQRGPLGVAAKGVKMNLSLFGRRARNQAEAPQDTSVAHALAAEDKAGESAGEPEAAEEETSTETEQAGETGEEMEEVGEGESASEGEEAAVAATPQRVVALCTEARVPQLANTMIQSGASLAEVKARIADARDIRDACAAAGVPHLADKAVEAIDQQRFADFVRTALTEATAAASSEEVSHHPPPEKPAGRAGINTVQYYQQPQR